MTTVLTGLAAVYAAAGLNMDAKESVSRDTLSSVVAAALAEGEKIGLQKAGNDATKIGADAVAAANVRCKTILGHAEAKGREKMAHRLAFESDMAADAAIEFLKDAPKGQAQSRLDGSVPDPKLTADENSGQRDSAASWDVAVAAVNKQSAQRGVRS